MAIEYAPKPNAPNRTGKRGRPKINNAKELVTLRLDPRVIAAFRAKGDGWQTKINAVLCSYLNLPPGDKI
ncbi:BrnA antitoxin family protein [Rhizobium rhizogenes]|uniref:BrnA antitoxin family protein n=1 Tax=Rhizobium rhizogenes TaxID=359 RepID=UPI00226EDAA3|nr:BrnA antitoxin family protein [Rhizobium rhizogenes]